MDSSRPLVSDGIVPDQQSNKPAGTILSQDLAPFKVVHANTKINFVVSGGPDYWYDPLPDDPFDTTPPSDTDDPYANWEPEEGFGGAPEIEPPETEDPFGWLDYFLNRN